VHHADIGGSIKDEYEEIAEGERQRAIKATEEIVRREEKREQEIMLEKYRGEWREERERLIRDCREERDEAVTSSMAGLEKKLRCEFDDELRHIKAEHENHIKETINNTWEEAEEIRRQTIDDVRKEEKEKALELVAKERDDFEQEKLELLVSCGRDKERALIEREEALLLQYKSQQSMIEQELQAAYERKLSELCETYESELLASQQLLEGKVKELTDCQKGLDDVTRQLDRWKLNYDNLKLEFAHFIGQFPGFDAEFLLKNINVYN
jgi:hypothetical protein